MTIPFFPVTRSLDGATIALPIGDAAAEVAFVAAFPRAIYSSGFRSWYLANDDIEEEAEWKLLRWMRAYVAERNNQGVQP